MLAEGHFIAHPLHQHKVFRSEPRLNSETLKLEAVKYNSIETRPCREIYTVGATFNDAACEWVSFAGASEE
jgi:hypothetical protein